MVTDGAHRYPQDGSDAPIRPVLDERPEDLQFAPGQPGRAAGCRHGPDRTQVARRLGGASEHGDPDKSALGWRPVVGGQERGVVAFGVDVTLIGAGVTVRNCLAAADRLAEDGLRVRVIDLYSVKPIDREG